MAQHRVSFWGWTAVWAPRCQDLFPERTSVHRQGQLYRAVCSQGLQITGFSLYLDFCLNSLPVSTAPAGL